MPIDLKNLLFRSNVGVGRAQNFSATNLGRESIKDAKVSVGQMNNSRPTTSVTHPGGIGPVATSSINQSVGQVRTSVNRPEITESTVENDNLVDENRYNYIRQVMRAKLRGEEPERVVGQVGAEDLKVRTGGGFRSKGAKGIRRQLSRLYKQAPSTYKNISMADRKYFAGVVGEHAGKVRVGNGVSATIRRKMKRQVNRDWKKGHVISQQDAQDFKKLINNLPH